MDERLTAFLDHAREKGLDFTTIRQLLKNAGWKDKDISDAFAAHELEMPVPEPRGASSARDTFLHLISFAALYTWVISLIVLIFTYVNLEFPDPADTHRAYRTEWAHSTIRQSLASILVAFPIFLLTWRSLLKEVAAHPEKRRSPERRLLIFMSLGVCVVTAVSDVITLVYYLLEGDLTTRFVLKVVALFVIAAAAFVYLGLLLREEQKEVA